MSLIAELKRRNVFRVSIAYAVIGWLLAQVAEFATRNFGAPEWILKIFVVFLLLGFILAVFFAWAFELTPEGLKKEKDVARSQSITRQTGRKLDFAIIAFLVLALGYFVYDKFVLDPARDAELDRMEEATILAQQLADSGDDVASLIGLLANTGRQEEMLRFFDDRWPSLDAYEADFPILGAGGIGTMTDIAYAYFSVGNQERFADAMSRIQAALEARHNTGIDNYFNTFNEGVYAALAGEHEAALTHLANVVDRGLIFGTRMSNASSALKILEGDPEYEAIQSRMLEHLNAERIELGLEPVTI